MRPAVNIVVAILKTENDRKPCIVFCDEVILPLKLGLNSNYTTMP